MSRVQSIIELADLVTAAKVGLRDEVARVFYTGRVIEWQIGYSEHDSSWEKYEVAGPSSDPDSIVIFKAGGARPSNRQRISALSNRIRLPKGEIA